MTWNVRRGKGRDGRVDLDRVARVVRAADPDVLALQELDVGRARTGGVNQPEALARLLGMHVCFSPTVHSEGDGSYGHALFTRAEPQAQTIVSLPRVPTRELRTLIEMSVDVGGTHVAFQSIHLGLLWPERFIQASAILKEHRRGEACVLMGDFNASAWMPTLRRLGKRFRDAAPGGGATWPSALPLRRLDYVLMDGGVRSNGSRVLVGGEASQASDHLGLVAEVVVG